MSVIKLFSALIPALVMLAAHYIPWRKATGRKLHRLEAYLIGTAGIVSAAAGCIEIADREGLDPSPQDAIHIIALAAAGAGSATVAAWASDYIIELKHKLADERSRQHARHRTTQRKARGDRNAHSPGA